MFSVAATLAYVLTSYSLSPGGANGGGANGGFGGSAGGSESITPLYDHDVDSFLSQRGLSDRRSLGLGDFNESGIYYQINPWGSLLESGRITQKQYSDLTTNRKPLSEVQLEQNINESSIAETIIETLGKPFGDDFYPTGPRDGAGLPPVKITALVKQWGVVAPEIIGSDSGARRYYIAKTRPMLPVYSYTIGDKHLASEHIEPELLQALWAAEKEISSFSRSVCKIHITSTFAAGGATGFYVGKDHVVTNAHVADDITKKKVKSAPLPFTINRDAYCFWHDTRGGLVRGRISKIVYYDIENDVAILKLRSGWNPSSIIPSVKLDRNFIATDKKIPIVVLGYPKVDASYWKPNSGLFADSIRLFEETFGGQRLSKRVSPGYLYHYSNDDRYYHDSTTFDGNSGSLVVSLRQSVSPVAIHYAGEGRSDANPIRQNYLTPFSRLPQSFFDIIE
ncbi:S1 family peptidase [Thalassobacterium maritimum]|uniref:S1 family peptidase n=1 Tax=Thalassobacterium maritimum TaxID=3041265 RepID=UPI002811E225|nr:serine protease [Coraliomargarita sp. SDUM461003]